MSVTPVICQVPCAGIAIEDPITFSGQLQRVGGRPIHPNLRTYDINGTGAMYSKTDPRHLTLSTSD